MKKIILAIFYFSSLASGSVFGQFNTHEKLKAAEKRINLILKQLTLEEKISMCSGAGSEEAFRGVPRLHIPDMKCSDGPRGPNRDGDATAFPSGIAFGATWDPALVQQANKVMGNESRAKGIGVLLAPAFNILRDPLDGRFFEYYTEDPFLNSKIAIAAVKGIQSEGVAACIKHFACNNREDNRNFYMSMIDDRSLNEIYFPAFKAAVEKGHAWTIMTSANGVNNEYVSDSKIMLTDILKNKWGFDGFVLTDWLQTRSTVKAAFAGLDVSMPGGENNGFGQPLLDSVKNGVIPISVIDDKVRRILRVYERIGMIEGKFNQQNVSLNTRQHQEVALKIAEQSIVLLKNDRQVLPINADKVKNVLLIGPNADKYLCLPGMGGSSGIKSPYEITPLKGLINFLGKQKVQYISSEDLGGFQLVPKENIVNADGTKGFRATYFVNGKEAPVIKRIDPTINFMWEMRSPDPSIAPDAFSHAHYEGKLIPPIDGKYTLRVVVGGIVRLYHGSSDGKLLAYGDSRQTLRIASASVNLRKGEPYEIAIDYEKVPGDAAIRLEWELPEVTADRWEKVDMAAQKADAIIFVGGIDHSMDTEGRDRKDLSFPGAQENILNRLSKINKNLVVVLINGSPLELGGWLSNVPAVIEAWYPGMEGGTAITNALFGKIDPSGKLPFSWPKKLSGSPAEVLGRENNDKVFYTDSLMVGYRYYDTKNIQPEFPFGFGLSYTTFAYGKVKLKKTGNSVTGTIQITNTGNRDGAEVVQVYVKPLNPAVFRPLHELKAFRKVYIAKGKQQNVSFSLGPDGFAYYDVSIQKWKVDPGKYEIQVGSSSRDIRAKALITIPATSIN
jgi:beta-glucosidase